MGVSQKLRDPLAFDISFLRGLFAAWHPSQHQSLIIHQSMNPRQHFQIVQIPHNWRFALTYDQNHLESTCLFSTLKIISYFNKYSCRFPLNLVSKEVGISTVEMTQDGCVVGYLKLGV